jgi:hypothetical protein
VSDERKSYIVTYISMVIEADSPEDAIARAEDQGGGNWEASEVRDGEWAKRPTATEFDHGITVGRYESEADGAHVIWIDTKMNTGRIRVDLNDGDIPLFDADPELHDHPLMALRKAYEQPTLDVIDEIEKSREADDMAPVFEARDAAEDLLSSILNRLRKETS